jgi:hypothetical protein
VKWDKAVAKLVKDQDTLMSFYDFPAEHWKHIRTSNPPSRACRHALLGNNRKHIRRRPAPSQADQGVPEPQDRPGHGLQTDDVGAEEMEETGRPEPLAGGHQRG